MSQAVLVWINLVCRLELQVMVNSPWRKIRGLRHAPPGYASTAARQKTFQAALEQFEQFHSASLSAGVATRPVQLFYALSQAARAIAAASPRLKAGEWSVIGHGLKTDASGRSKAAEVEVWAASDGLFPTLAKAIGAASLFDGEHIAIADLWPVLPEMISVPIKDDAVHPTLLFHGESRDDIGTHAHGQLNWIPPSVRDLCGQDPDKLRAHFRRYPSLDGILFGPEATFSQTPIMWIVHSLGLGLDVWWPRAAHGSAGFGKSISELKATTYLARDHWVVAPAVGSMTTPLHPLLAWWAVLQALSQLARYDPRNWANIIDIDRSPEANAIEHLLEQAAHTLPSVVHYILQSFDS